VLFDRDIQNAVVAAAVNKVEEEGACAVVEKNAKKVLNLIESFNVPAPTAVVILDFALYVLCTLLIDEGWIEIKPGGCN